MITQKINLFAQHSLSRSSLKSKVRVWSYHLSHENGQGVGSKIRLAHLLFSALLVFLVLWSSRRPDKSSTYMDEDKKVHFFSVLKLISQWMVTEIIWLSGPQAWTSPRTVYNHKQGSSFNCPCTMIAEGVQPHQNPTNMSVTFLYCCVSTVTCRGSKINWKFKRTK